ncbi:hypothetical protein NQ314_009971 [Rhamnusium bicolor]|uniref:Uncharacterized protein n=1 Tax=Rhamnusium bicolor TaxID=1586634 RepID=A0AAV8XUP5_9CUCU|nr:hypothetical protein NQ314_009971 [Rhamnusium bicolor]
MEYKCPYTCIAQLQWALSFLKTIHTRQGDHPEDVQLCVDALENILMAQYADLSTEVSGVDKLDETVHYIDGALGSNTMLTRTFPFSLNYSELVSKCTEIKGAVAQVMPCKSMTSAEALEELENIKNAAGVASIEELDSVSKEKAINILKCWKSDQVEKIREELKRLRSIEDKMKDIDDNFDGYIEDDLEMLYPK